MSRPACFAYWLEAEVGPGVWDSVLPVPASLSHLKEVEDRIQALREFGSPWAERGLRVTDQAGQVVRLFEVTRPAPIAGRTL